MEAAGELESTFENPNWLQKKLGENQPDPLPPLQFVLRLRWEVLQLHIW